MPHDIFISYSSEDRAKAEQLTELLSSAGLSVWIDHSGIDVATSWSGEIVDAIDNCKALVVLLSPSSVESKNVVREVALAFEKNKKILPLDLEPVALSRDLQYHLAGIQRAPMTNIDMIIRALGKFGLEATSVPTIKLVKETDSRKSLIILPFEDLSPTQDNQWFAEGMSGELIDVLGHIKSLRILDRNTSLGLRNVRQTTVEIAKLFNTRYFIEGTVRKFGDQIKISVSLLDIETGDHLWQHSHKGVMNDIFELQETVAEKVVEGLKIHLTSEERSKLEERGTENAEAYELVIKSREYFNRQTKEGCLLALELLTEAIRLDPEYSHAYLFKATVLSELYRKYDRDPQLLTDAEALSNKAFMLKPDQYSAYYPLAQIYMHQGKLDKAEETAKQFVLKDPKNSNSHFALAFFYANTGQLAKSIPPYEEAARLEPEKFSTLINLAAACDSIGDIERRTYWAKTALYYLERYLKLHPNDEHRRVHHAILLNFCGRVEEARAEALQLNNLVDGVTLYNASCLLSQLGDNEEALHMLARSVRAGFKFTHDLRMFIDDESTLSLREMPEYLEVKTIVEKLEADEAAVARKHAEKQDG
jgi:adenylate cyclase